MKLVVQTTPISNYYGDETVIRLIAQAGFDGYDFSFHKRQDADEFFSDKGINKILSIKKLADSLGITCMQAHAPVPSTTSDEEYNKKTFRHIVRSMEYASILGGQVIVVHPVHHLPHRMNKEALFEMSMEFYRRLIPYAEKFGIKIAVENMFKYDSSRNVIVDSACSRAEEFAAYIDQLNSPYITACLDVGHTMLVSDTPTHMIHSLGNRIGALHIHDNNGINDLHGAPYTGIMDWDALLKALADIGYSGNFTYETVGFFSGMPFDYLPIALKFLEQSGRYFIEKFESYKKASE